MKKFLKVFGIIVAICAVISAIVYLLISKGVLDSFIKEKSYVTTYRDEFGKIYTVRTIPTKKVKDEFIYDASSYIEPRDIYIQNDEDSFVKIQIPNIVEFVHNGSVIKSIDGSYSIKVIKGVNKDNYKDMLLLRNPELKDDYVIDAGKGYCTLVKFLSNDVIVFDLYEPLYYSLFVDVIKSKLIETSLTPVVWNDNVIKLNSIIYYGDYCSQYAFEEVNTIQKEYLFEDGFLTLQSIPLNIQKLKGQQFSFLEMLSEQSIKEVYNDSSFVYATSGKYALGIYAYNTNTSIVLIGKGEEARCNIAAIINSIK